MLKKMIKELAKLKMAQIKIESSQRIVTNSVPITGKVFDEKELEYMLESVLDCHWTEGRWNEMFESKLGEYL
jgi:CDP-6-deoxy-D-xylo-4-hexulose-3-dehydrase